MALQLLERGASARATRRETDWGDVPGAYVIFQTCIVGRSQRVLKTEKALPSRKSNQLLFSSLKQFIMTAVTHEV